MENKHHLNTDEAELRSLIVGSSLGALTSIPLGLLADSLGGIGFFPIEGIVRWIAGNADTAGEIVYTYKRKQKGHTIAAARTYVTGEVIGSLLGPLLLIIFHTLGKSLGLNPYGPLGIFIAASFAHADNIGGMIADVSRRIKKQTISEGIVAFFKSPYMQGNIIFITLSILLSLFARTHGFIPKQNFYAGIEGSLMGFSDSLGAGLYAYLVYWIQSRN